MCLTFKRSFLSIRFNAIPFWICLSKSLLSSLFKLGGADFCKFVGIEFSFELRIAESGVGGGGGGIGGVGRSGIGGIGGARGKGGDIECEVGGGGGGGGGIGDLGFCLGVVEGKGTLGFDIFPKGVSINYKTVYVFVI